MRKKIQMLFMSALATVVMSASSARAANTNTYSIRLRFVVSSNSAGPTASNSPIEGATVRVDVYVWPGWFVGAQQVLGSGYVWPSLASMYRFGPFSGATSAAGERIFNTPLFQVSQGPGVAGVLDTARIYYSVQAPGHQPLAGSATMVLWNYFTPGSNVLPYQVTLQLEPLAQQPSNTYSGVPR